MLADLDLQSANFLIRLLDTNLQGCDNISPTKGNTHKFFFFFFFLNVCVMCTVCVCVSVNRMHPWLCLSGSDSILCFSVTLSKQPFPVLLCPWRWIHESMIAIVMGNLGPWQQRSLAAVIAMTVPKLIMAVDVWLCCTVCSMQSQLSTLPDMGSAPS